MSFGTGGANLVECDFRGNQGSTGGAVYMPGGPSTFTLCEFNDNDAGGEGGAVWASVSVAPFEFINTLFLRNDADEGGGIYFSDTTTSGPNPKLEFCSLIGNAANSGGGIRFFGRDPQITSCILWDNAFPNGTTSYASQISDGGGGIEVVTYSDVMHLTPLSNGNTDADPTFLDPTAQDEDATNDYWLATGSPCIDAADSTNLPSGVTNDLADKPRVLDDPCTVDAGTGMPTYLDMGVYEFNRCVGVEGPCNEFNLGDCDPLGPTGPNGLIDVCEIAEFPDLDLDGSGSLDVCQPRIVQGVAGVSFAEHAFSGYIDPRQESSDGINVDLGIEKFTIVFAEPVGRREPAGDPLTAADFTVQVSSGTDMPKITDVDTTGNPSIVLTLDRKLPLQKTTIFTVDAISLLTGHVILSAGYGDPNRMRVGYLPTDVNQNSTNDPFDLLVFRQYANGILKPKIGVADDFVDTNRSGALDPFDLLVFRQLVNGVSPPSTRVWAGETLH